MGRRNGIHLMSAQEIESEFQKLRSVHYQITSQDTTDYNCFAWAMHDQNDWYSPAPMAGYYWPPNLHRNTTVATFIELYRQEGQFLPCDDGELEDGFEKIALYVNENGNVTHAARQKPSGVWTSKLG